MIKIMPNNVKSTDKIIWYCAFDSVKKTLQTIFKILLKTTLVDNSPELKNIDSFMTDEKNTLLDYLSTNEISLNNIEIPD